MIGEADVVVIGCGPAGISAATTSAALGLRVLLLDEQAAPGGQIYRGITSVPAALAEKLGPDYRHGRTLSDALATSSVRVLHGAPVFIAWRFQIRLPARPIPVKQISS